VGMKRTLANWAASRPHILMVDAPGFTDVRIAVEQWCLRTGAVLVWTPADADVLVLGGSVEGVLAAAAEELWREMPGPRARIQLDSADKVAERLDATRRELAAAKLEIRGDEWVSGAGHNALASHDGHDGHDMTGPKAEHSGHDMHAGHDMSAMSMPAGLDMAERADDRDRLKLDAVPFSLGPVLPGWSTGLVIDIVLQGDVIQSAAARPGAAASSDFWALHPTAARFDCASRLLTVLGWQNAAASAAVVRDHHLETSEVAGPIERASRLHRQVERSRLVRAQLTGLAVVDGADARDRLLRWLTSDDDQLPFASSINAGLAAIQGLELSSARLALASLPVDLESATMSHHAGHHG